MSATPHQLSDSEMLEILSLDRDFDMRTVMDRTGYPPIGFRPQTWRAQSDIAFPPEAADSSNSSNSGTPRRLCLGGKVYLAATG